MLGFEGLEEGVKQLVAALNYNTRAVQMLCKVVLSTTENEEGPSMREDMPPLRGEERLRESSPNWKARLGNIVKEVGHGVIESVIEAAVREAEQRRKNEPKASPSSNPT